MLILAFILQGICPPKPTKVQTLSALSAVLPEMSINFKTIANCGCLLLGNLENYPFGISL